MAELAQRLLGYIREQELLRAGDRIGVAVSGGVDSVALLRLLLELRQELGIVVSVVHFNHKLRGAESDADQAFVEGLARGHGLEFYCHGGDAAELASHQHSGLEAAARELRYGFFQRLMGAEESDSEIPQGLKPESFSGLNGTAEAVPLPSPSQQSPSQQGSFEQNPFQQNPSQQGPSQQNLSYTTAGNVPFQGEQNPLDKIATGHTLDDQAETVLMRMIRGTGPRGLGGIYPRIVVEHEEGEGRGEIVRPLLGTRRHELENYLKSLTQPWREDSTNADSRFTRNRVRKLVLPLLEREFNPSIADGLSELAEIARDEEDYWENEISGWLGTVVQWSPPEWARGLPGFDQVQPGQSQSFVQIQPSPPQVDPELMARLEEYGPALMDASVSRPWLLTEPKAVQRRVLKAIAAQAGIPLEFKHIEEILRFAAEDGPAGKELSLPLGWKISREPEALVFRTADLRRQERIPDYEYSLPVPGRVLVPELGGVIEALPVTPQSQLAEYNPQQLLRADLLQDRLVVRNWRAGDRFWPAHTKAPKKVKELLQELHLAQPARRLWPVVVSGDEIVWMRGFPVPARLRARPEQEALVIQETPAEQVDVI